MLVFPLALNFFVFGSLIVLYQAKYPPYNSIDHAMVSIFQCLCNYAPEYNSVPFIHFLMEV